MKLLDQSTLQQVSGGSCSDTFSLTISIPNMLTPQFLDMCGMVLAGYMPERDFFQFLSSLASNPGDETHLVAITLPFVQERCYLP